MLTSPVGGRESLNVPDVPLRDTVRAPVGPNVHEKAVVLVAESKILPLPDQPVSVSLPLPSGPVATAVLVAVKLRSPVRMPVTRRLGTEKSKRMEPLMTVIVLLEPSLVRLKIPTALFVWNT